MFGPASWGRTQDISHARPSDALSIVCSGFALGQATCALNTTAYKFLRMQSPGNSIIVEMWRRFQNQKRARRVSPTDSSIMNTAGLRDFGL